jgi:hypothetical protein
MWIYIPNTSQPVSLSAQASGDLTLLSPSQCQAIAPSVTWRGKLVQPQALSRRWRQGGFIRLLSGLTLEPSEASRGADAWISSLRAIHASPTASRGTAKAIKTNVSSSIKCFADLTKAGLILSSAKTSPETQTASSPHSFRGWKQWAAALRLEYSARPKRGTATGANDCSSWRSAHDHPGDGQHSDAHGPRMWPTARANDSEKRGEVGNDPRNGLVAAAEHWLTPNVPNGGRTIHHAEVMGRTAMHQGKKVQIGLESQVENCSTPRASDGEKGSPNQSFGAGGVPLTNQASNWSSPTVRIHKGGGTALTRADGRSRLDMLDWQAESWERSQVETSLISSYPDQAIGGGEASLTDIPNSNQPSPKRKLNPIFVEALMRWPTGLSGFDTAATALTPWLEQWRSFISMLASARAAMMPDRGKTIELRVMLRTLRDGALQQEMF